MHGGSGTSAQPPWTLLATAQGLGAFPGHQHPREPHERRRTRPVAPFMAARLVRRGVITRAIALAACSRLDRFLRRMEREGVEVEREQGGHDVVAYRFRVPEPGQATAQEGAVT